MLGLLVWTPPANTAEFTRETISWRAELAANYIARAQNREGTFGYEYEFIHGRYNKRDNIVRQAGTAFAAAEYLGATGDERLVGTVRRALAALSDQSIPHEGGLVLPGSRTLDKAPTGSVALALLAELLYFEATGDDRFAETRAGWTNALRAAQVPSGGFATALANKRESPYFNGETWLALAHYARLFPDDRQVKQMIARADARMMRKYAAKPEAPFSHWGMMAASTRYMATNDAKFLDFLKAQAAIFITQLRPKVHPNSNACSTVEGLASATAALVYAQRLSGVNHQDIIARIEQRIDAELAKSLQLQILPGQSTITFARDRYLVDPRLSRLSGAFRNSRFDPRARIDSTQHCLSGLLKYLNLRALYESDALKTSDERE